MHRQQIAVDQQFQVLGALRRRGGHQIGAVHQPVRRAVMLVEADPVIAKAVERLPGVEMLLIGAHRRRGIEMAFGERVGELGLAALQMVEIGVVGQEVEDKDFHSAASCGVKTGARWPRNARSAVAIAAISAKPQALKKICGGCMPSDRRYPPSTGAAMPPRRPMPSAQPMPLVRMRAGYSFPAVALAPVWLPMIVMPEKKITATSSK